MHLVRAAPAPIASGCPGQEFPHWLARWHCRFSGLILTPKISKAPRWTSESRGFKVKSYEGDKTQSCRSILLFGIAMTAPADHLAFLRQRDFALGCANIFTEDEHSILMRFGHWMTALASGEISPITPAEERFLSVDRGEVEPETAFEVAWTKLRGRRHFEEKERTAPHYRVFDAGEAWFPRSEHWRNT